MSYTLAEIISISIVLTLWNILLFVLIVRGDHRKSKGKGIKIINK